MNWYERLSDPRDHPRLAFLIEYVEGLAVIVAVYAFTRVAYGLMVWIDGVLPTHGPDDVHWYLPINFSRALVTIVDIVALLFVAITSIVGVIRLIVLVAKAKEAAKEPV